MTVLPRRQLGRTDRYVRGGRLRLNAGAPRQKLASIAEESLRLCSLPGEEEGRVYYFRRLHVTDLPEDGDRRAWLNAFQNAMQEQASQAIHGSHPRAATANSVYFRSEQEACESLLMRYAARLTPVEWYWPHVSGAARNASVPAQIAGVIERLLTTPAVWTAAAAAVWSVASRHDVVTLIKLLPDEAIDRWLRGMGECDGAYAPPVRLSESIAAILTRAIGVFGPDAAAVLWLAALAVIAIQPSAGENRSAVRMARASLREVLANAPPSSSTPVQSRTPAPATNAMRDGGAVPAPLSAPSPALAPAPIEDAPVYSRSSERALGLEHEGAPAPLRDELFFAEPTSGAGLYFLLNALTHLQVGDQHFSLLFLARLFVRIAIHAGIEADDPVLRWAGAIENQSAPEEIDERLLRIWLLKIRRWCWHNGRIAVREIVRRSGYVTLTRTSLDVTLSIDSADIRIRRIGLDLDPGWLPWFGRVVRFHYSYRGDSHG